MSSFPSGAKDIAFELSGNGANWGFSVYGAGSDLGASTNLSGWGAPIKTGQGISVKVDLTNTSPSEKTYYWYPPDVSTGTIVGTGYTKSFDWWSYGLRTTVVPAGQTVPVILAAEMRPWFTFAFDSTQPNAFLSQQAFSGETVFTVRLADAAGVPNGQAFSAKYSYSSSGITARAEPRFDVTYTGGDSEVVIEVTDALPVVIDANVGFALGLANYREGADKVELWVDGSKVYEQDMTGHVDGVAVVATYDAVSTNGSLHGKAYEWRLASDSRVLASGTTPAWVVSVDPETGGQVGNSFLAKDTAVLNGANPFYDIETEPGTDPRESVDNWAAPDADGDGIAGSPGDPALDQMKKSDFYDAFRGAIEGAAAEGPAPPKEVGQADFLGGGDANALGGSGLASAASSARSGVDSLTSGLGSAVPGLPSLPSPSGRTFQHPVTLPIVGSFVIDFSEHQGVIDAIRNLILLCVSILTWYYFVKIVRGASS